MNREELRARVVALVRSGHTFGEAAKVLGITRSAVAGLWDRWGEPLSEAERSRRNQRAKRPDLLERNREIRAAYATGLWSQREIARRFGMSQAGIRRVLGLREKEAA